MFFVYFVDFICFYSVGRFKYMRVMVGVLEGDFFIGLKVEVIFVEFIFVWVWGFYSFGSIGWWLERYRCF